MQRKDFVEQMIKIQTAYNKKFSSEELKLWFEEFKNVSADNFKNSVSKTIKEVKFIPKIADVKSRLGNSLHQNHRKEEFKSLYKNLEWCEMDLDEY